jgi:hypothetical protein
MFKINEHGCVTFQSADETIRGVFGIYVTSITIGDFWIHFGRDDVYKEDWDEMFFFHLHHNDKEIVTIYSYLPTSCHLRLFGKIIWD